MSTKEILRRFAPLLIIISVLFLLGLPGKLQQRSYDKFAKPLFSHAAPAGTTVLQTAAGKDEDGGITAAMLLETDLTSQELEAFYGDLTYAPAKKDHTVQLEAKALDEASLDVLEEAGLRKEGAGYQFVYLYSRPAASK